MRRPEHPTTDAVYIVKALSDLPWKKCKKGFHVYLRTISDTGVAGSPGPYSHTGSPLKHGRVFATLEKALTYAARRLRHDRYRRSAIKYGAEWQMKRQPEAASQECSVCSLIRLNLEMCDFDDYLAVSTDQMRFLLRTIKVMVSQGESDGRKES